MVAFLIRLIFGPFNPTQRGPNHPTLTPLSRNTQHTHSVPASTMRHTEYRTMITVLAFSDNPISQEEYNEIVDSLQIHHLACSCGRSACMHTHGYYVRYICLPDGKTPLKILRVKCSECITTHAILLSSIVPYSQISLQDQCSIISTYEQGTDCESQGLFSLAVKSAYRAHQPVIRYDPDRLCRRKNYAEVFLCCLSFLRC